MCCSFIFEQYYYWLPLSSKAVDTNLKVALLGLRAVLEDGRRKVSFYHMLFL